jgi:hypothetical protein
VPDRCLAEQDVGSGGDEHVAGSPCVVDVDALVGGAVRDREARQRPRELDRVRQASAQRTDSVAGRRTLEVAD